MQRIVDVRPNLVLVEKTVSRIAQDMLLEHGITLVINVKPVSVVRVCLFVLFVCDYMFFVLQSDSVRLFYTHGQKICVL